MLADSLVWQNSGFVHKPLGVPEMLMGSAGLSGRRVNTLQAVTPMLLENAEFCCTDSHHLSVKTIFLYELQLQSAKLLQKHSLCPLHRSDKISKVGPDILLDLLHSLFLPSKIGKFSNSKKNVHSSVNMRLVFFSSLHDKYSIKYFNSLAGGGGECRTAFQIRQVGFEH